MRVLVYLRISNENPFSRLIFFIRRYIFESLSKALHFCSHWFHPENDVLCMLKVSKYLQHATIHHQYCMSYSTHVPSNIAITVKVSTVNTLHAKSFEGRWGSLQK